MAAWFRSQKMRLSFASQRIDRVQRMRKELGPRHVTQKCTSALHSSTKILQGRHKNGHRVFRHVADNSSYYKGFNPWPFNLTHTVDFRASSCTADHKSFDSNPLHRDPCKRVCPTIPDTNDRDRRIVDPRFVASCLEASTALRLGPEGRP